ncbi:MAG TPA: acyl-CoA dehydrogenase family protein [Mycobacteriales bacterium]|jgi:alkylation response protein AidB-like acyl-CoA dehydrogenase|nr:acyl-CoA dehydrogenase family protein [Mycobacteriales bacterium]
MATTSADEQRVLRGTVRDLLAARSDEPTVRRLMETDEGFDPEVWSELGEMGLLGLAVPEDLGGAGFGLTEVGLVLAEAGRALLCAPYLSSVVMAQSALLASGDAAGCQDYLPALAAGQRRATLAYLEESGHRDAASIALVARATGSGWALDGVKTSVLDGASADLLLVVARTEAGLALFAVETDAAGLTRACLPTLDMTRKQARITFVGTRARLLGTDGDGARILAQVLDRTVACLAAEQVGGAERVLEMAVDYVKIRQQFGRSIGSFQAVKHACADMLLLVESARAAALSALQTADQDPAGLPVAASVVGGYCGQAYLRVAASNIQLHGGIGFTWEHPAHLYFKRAKTSQLLFGTPEQHREQLAQRAGIAAGRIA